MCGGWWYFYYTICGEKIYINEARKPSKINGFRHLTNVYKYEEEGEKAGKVTGNWRKIHEITNDQKLKMAGYDQEGTCDDHN